MKFEELLIEEKLDIKKEYFMSLIVDRSEKISYLLTSLEEGVNIEELKTSRNNDNILPDRKSD